MRLFAASMLLLSWVQNPTPTPRKLSKPYQQQTNPAQQVADADERRSEQSPLVVKALSAVKAQEETDQEVEDRKEKAANDRHIVDLTFALAVIAFLQFLVYAYQAKKLRETVESAGEQAEAMERHISEAARSATAMETIAKTIDVGNRAIMRAYLTVTIGSAAYQQRRLVGQPDLKFVARPNLVNTGNTAARKVRIRKTAAIVTNPVSQDFAFPLPAENNEGDATVSARLSYIMASAVDDFVPDAEVAAIKEGTGKCLCTWGVVTYEDIFGDRHTTKFAQTIYWNPDGSVYGIFVPGQNDAD